MPIAPSTCSGAIRSTTAASWSTSHRRSSTATCCCCRPRPSEQRCPSRLASPDQERRAICENCGRACGAPQVLGAKGRSKVWRATVSLIGVASAGHRNRAGDLPPSATRVGARFGRPQRLVGKRSSRVAERVKLIRTTTLSVEHLASAAQPPGLRSAVDNLISYLPTKSGQPVEPG